MKTCTRCGVAKEDAAFVLDAGRLRNQCRQCKKLPRTGKCELCDKPASRGARFCSPKCVAASLSNAKKECEVRDGRECNRCGVTKAITAFPIEQGRLRNPCRDCRTAYNKSKKPSSSAKEKQLAHRRRPEIKARIKANSDAGGFDVYRRGYHHGMSIHETRALIAKYGGRCAICGAPERAIDHSHAKKAALIADGHSEKAASKQSVRAVLCQPCNFVLGHYEKGWRPAGRIRAFDLYLAKFAPLGLASTDDCQLLLLDKASWAFFG